MPQGAMGRPVGTLAFLHAVVGKMGFLDPREKPPLLPKASLVFLRLQDRV